MITNSLAEVFSRNEMPNPAELEQVVVELKKLHKHYTNTNQGYYDRLQRGCSWLGNAKRLAVNPEAEFAFAWIALNALCGVRQEVFTTPWWEKEQKLHPAFRCPQKNRILKELEWFLWHITSLDIDNLLRDVIKRRFSDVKTVVRSRYLMPDFWTWNRRTEEDIKKATDMSEKRIRNFIGGSSVFDHEKLYWFFSEIIIGRLRILRNQLLHGCATDTHSKRRDAGGGELGAGTRILTDMIWAFINLMTTEPGRALYWPPIPFPRADSPQHQQFNSSWLSPMS